MAAVPGGCDAVKEVDASSDSLQQIRREADAHKITGYSYRQRRMKQLQHVVQNRLRLTHRQASDCYTGPGPSLQGPFERAQPKLLVHAALNDGPEGLRGSGEAGKGGGVSFRRSQTLQRPRVPASCRTRQLVMRCLASVEPA